MLQPRFELGAQPREGREFVHYSTGALASPEGSSAKRRVGLSEVRLCEGRKAAAFRNLNPHIPQKCDEGTLAVEPDTR
jgi:hypothetical protein